MRHHSCATIQRHEVVLVPLVAELTDARLVRELHLGGELQREPVGRERISPLLRCALRGVLPLPAAQHRTLDDRHRPKEDEGGAETHSRGR